MGSRINICNNSEDYLELRDFVLSIGLYEIPMQIDRQFELEPSEFPYSFISTPNA